MLEPRSFYSNLGFYFKHLPYTLFQHHLFFTPPLYTFPTHFISYTSPTHFSKTFYYLPLPHTLSNTFYSLHLPYTFFQHILFFTPPTLFQHMRQAGITESLPPTLDTETPGCCYWRQGRLRVPELKEVHGRKESSPPPLFPPNTLGRLLGHL